MKLITRFSGTPHEHKAALPNAANWSEQDWLEWADDQGKLGIYQDYLALTADFTPEQLAEFWTEPEPVVIPTPDWQGFINRLDLPTEENPGGTGLFAVLLGIDATSAWQSYNMTLNFLRGYGGNLELRTLGFVYSTLSQALSSEQQNQLIDAISEFNIPLEI